MNLSFKYKTLLIIYSIIALISLLIGSFSYSVYSRSVQNQISQANLIETNQIKNTIDSMQRDVDELSTFISLNSGVQSILSQSIDKNGLNVSSDSEVLKPLINLLASKDEISFIAFYANNGFKYYLSSDSSYGIKDYNLIKASSVVKQSIRLKGKPLWVRLDQSNQIFIENNMYPKIAMCRTILNTNTYKAAGFMSICINLSTIQKIYSENIKDKKRSILILDNNNKTVSFNNLAFKSAYDLGILLPYIKSTSGKKIITLNNKRVLLTHSTSSASGWKVIYIVPVSEILQNVKSIMFGTVVLIAICLIFAFILSIYVSSILSSPLKKLLMSMNKVKSGNFKDKVDFKYRDEIGMLGFEYNDMIDYINNLIDKVYKLQIQEKEAELRALEAQINPHFLYNTLDSIYWKALVSKNDEVSNMVYSLSRIFRLTLNRGNEFTSIHNEKEFIENYLHLQKMRFNDHLEYSIEFESDILDYNIPKLILQPFIENSIIHGVECKEDTGYITVKAYLSQQQICFEISDNGKGIESDQIRILLDLNSSNKKNSGYAIKNVNQRLFFYYGKNYSLKLESQINYGSKIIILIPACLETSIYGGKNDV